MRIAIINGTRCENVIACDSVELAEKLTGKTCVEAAEGYGIGDTYAKGTWSKPEQEAQTPAELRQQAYETEPIIEWQGELITVDAANDLWLKYSAEGSDVAATLSALIVDAKAKIREQYPDEV